MRPLAIVGNLSRDVVDGGRPRVGGAPFYAARALRVLGRPARILTRCADSDRATLLPPLIGLGVPVETLPGQATTGFSFSYDESGRRTMHVDALGDAWTAQDVARIDRRLEWVHAAPLLRPDFPPVTLAALARGRRLSLDAQGLARPGRTGPLELDGDFDRELLEHVSILKLAEEEAAVILGGTDRAAFAKLGVPEVVVTLGSRGSIVYAGGRTEEVPARAVEGHVDPTGAGDAFATVYLVSRAEGHAPRAAARRATALVAGLLTGRAR